MGPAHVNILFHRIPALAVGALALALLPAVPGEQKTRTVTCYKMVKECKPVTKSYARRTAECVDRRRW